MHYAAALAILLPTILASSPHTPAPMSPRHDSLLSIGARVSACVGLGVSLDLSARVPGIGANAQADVGACVCVDAQAKLAVLAPNALLGVKADVDVYVQLQTGAVAEISGQSGKEIAALVNLDLGSACTTPASLFPNSVHDFANGCCARKCLPGFIRTSDRAGSPVCEACPVRKPNSFTLPNGSVTCLADCKENEVRRITDGQCLCPLPFMTIGNKCKLPDCPGSLKRLADGSCGCKDLDKFACGTACVKRREYTCPSGVPVMNPKTRRSRYECPVGKSYCPAVGHGGWECIDTMTDIESCGGCADPSNPFGGPGIGADCTSIAGTNVVSCHRGECHIHSCEAGWAFAEDGKACARIAPGSTSGHNGTQQKLVVMRQS